MGKKVSQYIASQGLSVHEFCHVPDVVFLADYVSSVPAEWQDLAERYIRDGSKDFFPELTHKQLAQVPPLFRLVLAMPKMDAQEARKLAGTERIARILRVTGIAIADIADKTADDLVHAYLSKLDAKAVNACIEDVPKLKSFLRESSDPRLRAIADSLDTPDTKP